PLSEGGLAVQDRAAPLRPEQVRRGSDLRSPLVPPDLPRLSERQLPTAVLESFQVEMGDPAELRHPGGHDHATHGFALAALLENRQSLTDERQPVLELRVHSSLLRSLVTTRKYTRFYVRVTVACLWRGDDDGPLSDEGIEALTQRLASTRFSPFLL